MMKRRGNKSHKVPNVKLRPALPSSRSLQHHNNSNKNGDDVWSHDPILLEETQNAVDLCPRPFKGLVVCATGVVDKPTLFKQAVELGATSTSALTDRVTHLIANDHGGAKYMCALERKIPILRPSWITESYQVWLRGDDVDLHQTLKSHRLPIFSSTTISLSGITSITRRTQIHKLVIANGGEYVKDIERPVKVTHLLCSSASASSSRSSSHPLPQASSSPSSSPSNSTAATGIEGDDSTIPETPKMHYCEKFNRQGEARIYIVWEEWFWDSLEFGGRFDEGRYAVRSTPKPKRRVAAGVSLVPSEQEPSPPEEGSAQEPRGSRQESELERDKDGDQEEPEEKATIKRVVPAFTLQLWESLLKPRGFGVIGGKLVRSPTAKGAAAMDVDDDEEIGEVDGRGREEKGKGKVIRRDEREGGKPASVLASFSRANSFTLPPSLGRPQHPSVSTTGGGVVGRQPFRRVASVVVGSNNKSATKESDAHHHDSHANNLNGNSDNDTSNPPAPPQIFKSHRFRLLGEARCQRVRSEIEKFGGRVLWSGDEEDNDVDFAVVRLVSGSIIYRTEPSPSERAKYRTECWLERCMFEERVCEPGEHVAFVPLPIGWEGNVVGAEDVNLSFSGLDQSEACWVRRLLRALGVPLAPAFSRRSTHLLCPSGTGAKFDKAKAWGVPVVGMGWMEDMVRTGMVGAVERFLVGGMEVGVGGSAGRDAKDKGKEKEMVDVMMVDITNNNQSGEGVQPPTTPKANGLERMATVLPESPVDDGDRGNITFGRPNGSLTGGPPPPKRRRLSTATPPPPSSRSTSASTSVGGNNNNHNNNAGPSRKPTLIALETELRIPSSTSPSPMKMPIRSRDGSYGSSGFLGVGAGLSPAKVSNEATKALQESITSLLGKRQNSEEDTNSNSNAAQQVGKAGKRGRLPSKSKPQSRQESYEFAAPPHSRILDAPASPYNRALSPFEPYDRLNLATEEGRSHEESMRVTYEDPGQRDEKRRLMSLFENQSEDERGTRGAGRKVDATSRKGPGLPVAVRRSTRVAGF